MKPALHEKDSAAQIVFGLLVILFHTLSPASAAEYSPVGPGAQTGKAEYAAPGEISGSAASRTKAGVNGTKDDIAAPGGCVECHLKSNPAMVAAWQHSRHAANEVGCASCHGSNHSKIFEVKGAVSAAVCGSCHARQVKEFDRSLHAAAVDLMKTDPRFDRLSPVMADLACNSCHQIGMRFADGSRGKCNSCHSGHSFSSAEARRPEACATCHTGPDHPHLEMWQASKHGQLFAAEETRSQAPTCVTCHMPGGTHDTGTGLSFGNVANGAVLESSKPPVKMRSLSVGEAERQRGLMIKTCLPCHSSRFASESLGSADLVKHEADALLGAAAEIMARLKKDGFLREGSQASSDSMSNKMGDRGELRRGVSDPDFEGPSLIEQRYFDMVKFHHATTFKGAYHHSPMHTQNLGFLRLKQDLNFINSEAAEIRNRKSRRQP